LKWDKNKGTKGYLRLVVDDAGVVGVLRRDVRHWFVRVSIDGGGGRCAGVISQHVGQLRGRIEGFCALHLKLRDFFALLLLKPKGDRISLREGMVNSQSVKEIDITSFDLLLVGNNED
jgi:hypothetical protein